MQFCTLTSKKSLRKSKQKLVKCWMKAPIRQVLLHTSMFILQFSKRSFKNPLQTDYQLQTDACVTFVKSLSSVPSTSSLSTTTSQSLSQQSFWLTLLLTNFALEDPWMAISNHFHLYRVVISTALLIWPNTHFF